jgi:hypothetical protein
MQGLVFFSFSFSFFFVSFFLLRFFLKNKYAMMQMMQTRLVGYVSQNTGSKLRLELGTTNSSETQSHLRPQNSEPIVTNRITSHQQVTNKSPTVPVIMIIPSPLTGVI